MFNHAWVRFAAVAILAGTATGAGVGTALAADAPAYPGYTQPSELRKLNFNMPGVVVKIHVKEGDFVKAGTLVAEQDDRVEQKHLEGIMIEASSQLQIVAAQKTLEEKKIELDRKKKMQEKKVIGEFEVLEAILDVDIAQARLELAKEELLKKQTEAGEERAKIAQKKLFATTDGIVQQIGVHEGELTSNDPKTPVVAMVTNEPLFVEVNLPIAEAKALQLHQKVKVRYEDEESWRTAEVIFFDPVANAMARIQKTRLQLDNPEHLRAGLTVMVKLGDKVASAQPAR